MATECPCYGPLMGTVGRLLRTLDPWLYRHAFEGASARRYETRERGAFGDLDARLVAGWHEELMQADRFLDLGCGPATLSRLVAKSYPDLQVIGAEPSRDFTRSAKPDLSLLRSRAEALPLASNSIGLAAAISSIRHMRDRGAALGELRRVIRPGGTAYIVELDPMADRVRAREHTRALGSPLLRMAFVPLVLATAPRAETIIDLARAAGWSQVEHSHDAQQPVYLLRLS